MRTRNSRRKVLFGTNYPMIFHEPALAALALDDEAPTSPANAKRDAAPALPRERQPAGRRVSCPQRTTTSNVLSAGKTSARVRESGSRRVGARP